jgi:orotate phosphoribosyltransferase
MIKTPEFRGAFVQDHGLILPDASVIGAGAKFDAFDVLLGYEATGFLIAAIVSVLEGRHSGLLRKERKPYGLERIAEAAIELKGCRVAVLHAEPLSESASQAIDEVGFVSVPISPADRLGEWPSRPRPPAGPSISSSSQLGVDKYESERGFRLSSGETTSFYHDVFRTLLEPASSLEFARLSGVELESYDSMIGMAKGGIFFSTVLALTAGRRPMVMDHGKADFSPISKEHRLGATLLVDETVGSGDYFRIATRKLEGRATKIDYLVAARFKHRGALDFPVMNGVLL